MRYTPHEFLIAPARGNEELWRLGVGIAAIVALFLTLSMVYSELCRAILPEAAWGADGLGLQNADTQWGALANLYVFAMLVVAVWAALVLLHGRGLSGLIGPLPLALRQFGRVLALLAVLSALLMLLPMPKALTPYPHLDFADWLMFLPLALVGLAIQTSAEEIVFRGYLQSQLAARIAHPAVWMGVPSALFALLHYMPADMGDNAWLIALWAGAFGLAAADLTARSGTLGPAIALHLANNFSALLIAAPEGAFDGLALYNYPFALNEGNMLRAWMPVDLMMLFCSWLTARLALRA